MNCLLKSLSTFTVAVAAVLSVDVSRSHAQILFQDTFNRADSRNIDGSLGGITDNTGSALPINGVYTHAFIDALNSDAGGNLPQDGNAANGGGAQILSNNLQLAVGAGTSNAYVNHNFINSDILTAGAFSVSLDVVGFNQNSDGQGGGFAIGMTQAEADSAGDANGGGGASAFTSAFNTNGVVSDFWVALRGSSTVAWGDSSGLIGSANVGAKTGVISANFGVDSFAQGSVVTYEVFHNGNNVAVGAFSWSDDNANFIGLDARDSAAVSLDNFIVQTSTPPVVPTLSIDRTTGQITLTNELAQPLSLIAYSLTSASGGFRVSNWDTIQSQGIDANDTWITLTDTSGSDVVSDLSEATFGEHTLAPSASIQLGEGSWIRSPFEDINLEIRDASGNRVPFAIQYVNGDAIALGDYNANGMIDSGDWPTIRDNLVSDVSALSAFEAYLSGDLTGDGMVHRADFRLFKDLWLAENPGGNLAALFGTAPEPTAAILVAAALVCGSGFRRHSRRIIAILLVTACVSLSAHEASAITLFEDTFNRADNRNIDASLTGVTNNTGSALPVDGVYSQPHLDPEWEATGEDDDDAADGGGAQIIANELQLAVQDGTSNAFVNHNFVNPQILTDGGFRVSFEVTSYAGTARQQGGAIALGMSQAEAASTRDAFSVTTNPTMTGAFNDDGFLGNTYPDTVSIVSDFWLAIRGNNSLAWGSGNGPVQGVPQGALAAKTGAVAATFAPSGFNAGDAVAYEVFYAGASQGFGTFYWSEDMQNYIGLDARDGTGVNFNGFAVETVTDAAINPLRLQVNTTTGVVSIAGGDISNALDYYEISSDGGLIEGSFTGLAGAGGFPAGNGSGNGWELGGVQSSSLLNETYLQDSSTIAASASGVSLGAIYNTGLDTRDLRFNYDLPNGTTIAGYVEYITGNVTLPDFNGNGVVDAADYTIWRDNLGLTGAATFGQGDANGDGDVTQADYMLWRDNYGATVGLAAGLAGAAPEPSALALLLAAPTWAATRRRRR